MKVVQKQIILIVKLFLAKHSMNVLKLANTDNNIKTIIPESNKTTGNIGIEYLIFKFRLNIYAEHFYKISHNLLGFKGSKINDVKDVYSHAQALSQSSIFIKKIN